MLRDSPDRPVFPCTFTQEIGHTGNVWAFLFWWIRNGQRSVDEATTFRDKKQRLRSIHRISGYLVEESLLLPWG